MEKAIYDSAWHHPGIAFVAAALFLFLLAGRQKFLTGWAMVFLFEIVADAFVTGAFTPVREHGTPLEKGMGITFVILGDFRYFLLVEVFAASRAAPRGMGSPLAWVVAVVLAFVVPVLSVVPHTWLWPEFFADRRRIFLLYEAMFFVFVLGLRFAYLPKRLAATEPTIRAWLLRLTAFELVQYGLWIGCDVLILAGVEQAVLLRLAPNALYYAAFVPYAYLTAPGAARA